MRSNRAAASVVLLAGTLVFAAPATGQTSLCAGHEATMVAGPDEPTIGTGEADVIVGTAGDDEIFGGGGDDIICGLGGSDRLFGNAGDDLLNGGAGADRLKGGKGIDRLIGSTGGDKLWGNSGNDNLSGSKGNDLLRGGSGDDRLRGRAGRDELRGNRGTDNCRGGSGRDMLRSCNEAGPSVILPPEPRPSPTPVSPRPTPNPAVPTPAATVEPAVTPTSTPTPVTPGSGTVTFTAGGDYGTSAAAGATLSLVASRNPQFSLGLGDLGYGGRGSESAWCGYAGGLLGGRPLQVLAGNHEDDHGWDGHINNFAACMPDRMGSIGTYGAEYYFDVDGLVRVIMIAADSTVNGVAYDYTRGNSHYAWLETAIDDARARQIPWIVVGTHKVCITGGNKACEIGQDVVDLLLDKRVDLIVSGHEHNYQRSKQLTCASVNNYRPTCVADSGADGDYDKGDGSVWVIAGATGGQPMYAVTTGDPEIGYMAEWMGGNHPQAGQGVFEVSVSANRLDARFIGSTTSYSDQFVID